jgi:hypothetical protein
VKVVAPVPPFATGTVLRVMAGVVVPVATVIGEVPVTLVTVPVEAAPQDTILPLFVRTSPLTKVGSKLVRAAGAVTAPVPPFAMGTVASKGRGPESPTCREEEYGYKIMGYRREVQCD